MLYIPLSFAYKWTSEDKKQDLNRPLDLGHLGTESDNLCDLVFARTLVTSLSTLSRLFDTSERTDDLSAEVTEDIGSGIAHMVAEEMLPVLAPTIPHSISSATRQIRSTSLEKKYPANPTSVSFALAYNIASVTFSHIDEDARRLTITSSSDENLNSPATGPKVSSVAINYIVSYIESRSQKETYTIIRHVCQDCRNVFGPVSSLTAN
jgi:hypothetical protein